MRFRLWQADTYAVSSRFAACCRYGFINDYAWLAGLSTITGGAGADSLTGGAGDDDFVYTAVADSAASVAADTTVTFDTITDFTSGSDQLNIADINGVLTGGAVATGVAVTTLTTGAGSLNDTTIADFDELRTAVDNFRADSFGSRW